MGRNISTPTTLPPLSWGTPEEIQSSLKTLNGHAERVAEEAIRWYLENKSIKHRMARGLRFAAIILTAFGGLVPLLVAGRFLTSTSTGYEWAQLGYISLALAASCVGLDRFFGYSSGWIRYITTALILQRLYAEYQLDWVILNANLAASADPVQQREILIQRVRTLVLRVRDEVDKETAVWAAEYQNNLTELEKTTREQLVILQPAVINVTIPNVDDFKDGVVVLLDGHFGQTVRIATCQITPVFPGSHIVSASGVLKADDRTANASSAITVTAGQVVALTLEPKPA